MDVFRNLKKILNTFFKDLFENFKNLPLLFIVFDIEFFLEMQDLIITSLVKISESKTCWFQGQVQLRV